MKSRSQEEVADFYFRRIRSLFGSQVATRYVDIDDPDMEDYPQIRQWLKQHKIELPAVVVDNVLVLDGRFTSGQILTAVRKRLRRRRS